MPVKYTIVGLSILFLFYSCERPNFIKKVDPPTLISKSYTVREFVKNQAEIVWVIDNSGSMDEHQQSVIANMDIFMNSFVQSTKGADWRMALLSTDKDEQPYIGFLPYNYLDHTDPDAVMRFNRAVASLGTSGDASYEQAFYPIQAALSIYSDFLRENSKLFLIIVSDELEQGKVAVDDFLRFLYSLRDPEDIATYGVFSMSEDGCGMDEFIGSRYAEFIQKTNGLTFPICASDYGAGLATFGADIAQKTSVSKIQLKEAPVIETLEVIYRGKKLPKGRSEDGGYWNYNSVDNSIHFHDLEFLVDSDSVEKVRVVFEEARFPED